MRNKLLNFILLIIFTFFFIHFLKDITQDILKIKTPLDYLGNVNEDLSLFSPFIKNVFSVTAYLSFIGEALLIIVIPLHFFSKKRSYLLTIWIISILIFIYFLIAIFLDPKLNIYSNKNNHCLNFQAKIYSVNNKNYCLLTASNQEQWEKGLMFYKKPINFDGMIFIFPNKQMRSFWNKNTYLDLDVYWLNDDKIIGKSFLPSILKSKKTVTVQSTGEVNRVMEIVK